jgi:hypothetical protein
MTSDEVYKLIENNGLTLHGDIEHFAELVAQREREREWVGLTKEERHKISMANRPYCADIMAAHEEELKRRNT